MLEHVAFYIVICDGCGVEHPDAFVSQRDAIAAARAHGWRTDDDVTDLCPSCSRDHVADPAP